MHDDYREPASVIYNFRGFDALGARIDAETQNTHYSISEAINNLRHEFEAFKVSLDADIGTLIEKLRECARANDLIDEQGGSLDEFLNGFKLQSITPNERSD